MVKIEELNQLWCEILGREEIENHENFYELGGNSLLLLMLLNEISKKYRYDLPTADVYRYDTVLKMADCLENELEKKQHAV